MTHLLNTIPIVGWGINVLVCFLASIPLYFLWNWIVPIYGTFLPTLYQHLPFWHLVGILWLVQSLKDIILPLGPFTQTLQTPQDRSKKSESSN